MKLERPTSTQPLPSHANLVFKGKIFEVYQWQQEGYDGSIHIFEKIKRSDTVVILPVTNEGKILLGLQEQPGKPPFSGPIGGRVDDDEDPFLAAQRELLEETGYVSDKWELFKAFHPHSKIDWVIYYLIARDCRKVRGPDLDGAEKIEVCELTFEQFLEFILRPDFQDLDLQCSVLKAKLNVEKMDELRKVLFGEPLSSPL